MEQINLKLTAEQVDLVFVEELMDLSKDLAMILESINLHPEDVETFENVIDAAECLLDFYKPVEEVGGDYGICSKSH